MTTIVKINKPKIKQVHIYKRKELNSNPVEDYLKNNMGKNLSVKKLQKHLNIRLRAVFFLIKNSNHIQKVSPLEVGSGKKVVNVYTYSLVRTDSQDTQDTLE